jgi:diguanylate cyclase (GGDEF)-like protein
MSRATPSGRRTIASSKVARIYLRNRSDLTGGTRVALLLPGSSMEEATETAERLRACIADLEIVYGDVHTKVTASFGLAHARSSDSTWDDLLIMCDQALYSGKRSGGNLVRTGSDSASGIPMPNAVGIEVSR